VPRVTVLHPMPWANYLAMSASRTMDIGLVPLFDSPFNAARSHCKLLDITRQQAVGIYSEQVAYSEEITNHDAGIVVDNRMESWLQALALLLEEDRSLILANAQNLINNHLPNPTLHAICNPAVNDG